MWDEDPLPWRYIAKALEVEPTNPTYLALRLQQHPVAYHWSSWKPWWLMVVTGYNWYILIELFVVPDYLAWTWEGGTYWQVAPKALARSCELSHVDPYAPKKQPWRSYAKSIMQQHPITALRSHTDLVPVKGLSFFLAARSQFLTEPKEESQSTSGESTSAPLGDQSSLGESSEPPANELASTEGSKKSRTSRTS